MDTSWNHQDDGRPRLSGRHVVLPARVYADQRVSSADRDVLAIMALTESGTAIQRRDGWFAVSQDLIAQICRSSRSSVSRSVKRLRDSGYLTVLAQYDPAGGQRESLYRIVFDHVDPLPEDQDRYNLILDRMGRTRLPLFDDLLPDDPAGAMEGPQQAGVEAENSQNLGNNSQSSSTTQGNRGVSPVTYPPCHGCSTPPVTSDVPPTSPVTHPPMNTKDSAVCHPCDTPPVTRDVPPKIPGNPRCAETPFESNQDSIKDSIRFDDRFSGNDEEDAASGPERLADHFLALRLECFPDVGSRPSNRQKLIEAAKVVLGMGLDLDQAVNVLESRMRAGGPAPASLMFYKNNFKQMARSDGPRVETELRRAGNGERRESVRPAERPQRDNSQFEAFQAAAAGGGNAWASDIREAILHDGTLFVAMATRVGRDQLENDPGLMQAARDVYGTGRVEVVIGRAEDAVKNHAKREVPA